MIDGNTTVAIQIRKDGERSKTGEKIPRWETIQEITGWMDLSGEDTKYTAYLAKIQESTHIFISDYVEPDRRIRTENSRLIDEDGLMYDILLIDDPMKMHDHLEIYLKYTGGQG